MHRREAKSTGCEPIRDREHVLSCIKEIGSRLYVSTCAGKAQNEPQNRGVLDDVRFGEFVRYIVHR